MMRCVKCDGQSVFPAMNEAPDGVRDWRKCLSCGKRWDPTTAEALDTVKQAFEEWQPGDETAGVNVHGDDETDEREIALDDHADLDVMDDFDEPVVTKTDLAMRDVLVKRGPKKKAREVRMAIGGTCTARGCRDSAAQDSVKCERHRDIQREKNAKYQGRSLPVKPGRRAAPAAVVSVPVRREPETLATPRPVVIPGDVLSVLDAAIVSATADVQALERTREILSRQAC